jgi:hypothetical protein
MSKLRTNPYEVWDKEIDPRIELLRADKYHLEAFYLFSTTLEFTLRETIIQQERGISNLLSRSKFSYKKQTLEDLESKTLGQLITLFTRFYNEEAIVEELKNFNAFRTKVIHKLIEGNISELNKKASHFYSRYNMLIANLSRYNMSLSEKEIRRLNRRIKMLGKKSAI